MKNSIQQEVLLLKGTTFSTQQWCEKDAAKNKKLSQTEQLEDACWNGLVNEMLPEIIERSGDGKKLLLWHVRHGASFLQLDLSETPQVIAPQTSIDPYFFLPSLLSN